MLFWLICALLTVAVTLLTLRPVLSHTHSSAGDNPDLRVYKDQLTELDRDIARGLLSGEEAEAARIEISRRILAVGAATDTTDTGGASGASKHASLIFSAAAVLVMTSSLGLYLLNGSPGYSSQPFAERASKSAKGAPVTELIARVEARLREAPDDGQGWDVLAPGLSEAATQSGRDFVPMAGR